jgi:biopolymer transport protein TolQ
MYMQGYLVNLITLSNPDDLSIPSLILKASPVVQAVLVLLAVASMVCWWIIGTKMIVLKKARRDTAAFLDLFWSSPQIQEVYDQSGTFEHSPVVQCFHKAYVELAKVKETRARKGKDEANDIENIYRALKREQGVQMQKLSQRTSILATIASAAPFIGLFGTVWGIMHAFLNIAKAGNATLTTVAPPIAEALIATAIGLVAAIPAVIAYNMFLNQLKDLDIEIDTFSNDFLNIIKRHLG